MDEGWDKNSHRLCIECKYHRGFNKHQCYHPYNLDSVSGSPRESCWQMRHTGDLMRTKCTLGKLFEEGPKESKDLPKSPWYKKLFIWSNG
jgi:hypothetical protein